MYETSRINGDGYTSKFSVYMPLFLSIYYWCLVFVEIFVSNRDGTSIILSDDVGQLYILSTGQGESQNDAKYDQVYTLTT